MVLKALGKISTREASKGLIQYNKGDIFVVPDNEGERLLKLKVATYEGESLDEKTEEPLYLSSDKLRKLDKAELVEYAASIGLKLEHSSKKDDLVNTITDFIEEQQAMEERT